MARAWNQVDPWLKAALIAWALLTFAVCVRSIAQPHRSNAAALWQAAGQAWLDGEPLYPTSGDSALAGYRSSPVGACLFALLVPLPLPVAGVLFRVLATVTFVASAVVWMRWGLNAPFSWRQVGIALLLMLPLALTSLNSAQVNLFAIALMLASLTAAANERWWLAGLGSALAGLLLLYPLGLALLLFLSFPRRFTLPFLAALALVASVPLLFCPPAYVLDQYLGW